MVSGPLETTTSTLSPQCSVLPLLTEVEITWPCGILSSKDSVQLAVSLRSSIVCCASSFVLPTILGMVTGFGPCDTVTVIVVLCGNVAPGSTLNDSNAPCGTSMEYVSSEAVVCSTLSNPAFFNALIGSLPDALVASRMSAGTVACLTPLETTTLTF